MKENLFLGALFFCPPKKICQDKVDLLLFINEYFRTIGLLSNDFNFFS